MSLATFTAVHVVLSMVGIGAGLIVMLGLIARSRLDSWTTLFLGSTAASVVTGFLFPFVKVTPAHIFGVLSTIVLVLAIVARYKFGLAGRWRRTYVVSASIALYLNAFIAVVQAFQKVPALSHEGATMQVAARFWACIFACLLACGKPDLSLAQTVPPIEAKAAPRTEPNDVPTIGPAASGEATRVRRCATAASRRARCRPWRSCAPECHATEARVGAHRRRRSRCDRSARSCPRPTTTAASLR
jgi:hypothetical protein